MKFITAFYLLIFGLVSFGQTIDTEILNNRLTLYTCNKDSLFFNSDTIKFSTLVNGDNCCDYLTLEIKTKKKIELYFDKMCGDPTIRSGTFKSVRLFKRKSDYIFVIYESNHFWKEFRVAELIEVRTYDDKGVWSSYKSMTLINQK